MSDSSICNEDDYSHDFLRDYPSTAASSSDVQEKWAFTRPLREGDQPNEGRRISPELIAAIASIQPEGASEGVVPTTLPELIAAIASIQPEGASEGVVPTTLPEHLTVTGPDISDEELRSRYDLHQGMSLVGSISALDLVVLHLRNYRSIVEYNLADYGELYKRHCTIFASIWSDLTTQLGWRRRAFQVRKLRNKRSVSIYFQGSFVSSAWLHHARLSKSLVEE